MQVYKCMVDDKNFELLEKIHAYLKNEIYHLLRHGGEVFCCHCEWDSVIYNGEDKEHIKDILNKYSNGKQLWMDDADSLMGRRFWGLFNCIGTFSGEVQTQEWKIIILLLNDPFNVMILWV